MIRQWTYFGILILLFPLILACNNGSITSNKQTSNPDARPTPGSVKYLFYPASELDSILQPSSIRRHFGALGGSKDFMRYDTSFHELVGFYFIPVMFKSTQPQVRDRYYFQVYTAAYDIRNGLEVYVDYNVLTHFAITSAEFRLIRADSQDDLIGVQASIQNYGYKPVELGMKNNFERTFISYHDLRYLTSYSRYIGISGAHVEVPEILTVGNKKDLRRTRFNTLRFEGFDSLDRPSQYIKEVVDLTGKEDFKKVRDNALFEESLVHPRLARIMRQNPNRVEANITESINAEKVEFRNTSSMYFLRGAHNNIAGSVNAIPLSTFGAPCPPRWHDY